MTPPGSSNTDNEMIFIHILFTVFHSGIEHEIPTSYSSTNVQHDNKRDNDTLNAGNYEQSPFSPLPEGIRSPSDFLANPPFYESHAYNLQPPYVWLGNNFPELLHTDYGYTHYNYPSFHPLPTVDPYPIIEGIRYEPMLPEAPLYKPGLNDIQELPTYKPIPYLPATASTNMPVLPEIQDDMVKKIIQIVSDFEKSNKTLLDDVAREDSLSPLKNMTTFIATTTIEENNTTKVESTMEADESRTEIHSDGNRTETAEIVQVPDDALPSTTILPLRYVVEHFVDQNRNPCTKEIVMTSNKKTYYVYTCEEKNVPQTTSEFLSDVTSYKHDLTTIAAAKEDGVQTPTTPLTEEQTLPETLNDYVVFNKQ